MDNYDALLHRKEQMNKVLSKFISDDPITFETAWPAAAVMLGCRSKRTRRIGFFVRAPDGMNVQEENHKLTRKLINLIKAFRLRKRALVAYEQERYPLAVLLLSHAITAVKESQSPILFLHRAECFLKLKVYNLAMEDLKKVWNMKPGSIKSGLYMATIYYFKGKMGKFQETVDIVKNYNEGYMEFINDYLRYLQD